MYDKFTSMTEPLYRYVVDHGTARDPLLDALAEETAKLGTISMMQIAPEQGSLMTLLARSIGARKAIEVGTFTGYSSICIARGLGSGGRLITCDVNEDWTATAREYFRRAGLQEVIDLRIGPAIDTLRALPREPVFDFAFVDADKTGYRSYYEEILARLRPSGLILFDNVLWMGQVLDAADESESTRAIRELNDEIARDERVEAVMLPVADGITLVRKRDLEEANR